MKDHGIIAIFAIYWAALTYSPLLCCMDLQHRAQSIQRSRLEKNEPSHHRQGLLQTCGNTFNPKTIVWTGVLILVQPTDVICNTAPDTSATSYALWVTVKQPLCSFSPLSTWQCGYQYELNTASFVWLKSWGAGKQLSSPSQKGLGGLSYLWKKLLENCHTNPPGNNTPSTLLGPQLCTLWRKKKKGLFIRKDSHKGLVWNQNSLFPL